MRHILLIARRMGPTALLQLPLKRLRPILLVMACIPFQCTLARLAIGWHGYPRLIHRPCDVDRLHAGFNTRASR